MYCTYKYRFKPNAIERRTLKLLAQISKNIYNSSLYILRQHYFKTKKLLPNDLLLEKMMDNENLKISSRFSSPCIMTAAYAAFGKFARGNTKMPKYLKKDSLFPIITNKLIYLMKKNVLYVKLPLSALASSGKIFKMKFKDDLVIKYLNEYQLNEITDVIFKVPNFVKKKKIVQLRIAPKANGEFYEIEFSYLETRNPVKLQDCKNIMGIDIGIANLATCVISNNKSFIIDGKYLKSINQFYNKRRAYLQSVKPDQNVYTKMEILISEKRKRKMADVIKKGVKIIIKECEKEDVGEIIIGYNQQFKQGGIKTEAPNRIKKQINQNFVQIPIAKFKNKLANACAARGIVFKEINEEYTSKCSFYDGEEIKRHLFYKGKRISRGLFKTKSGMIVNADVNAALNILKKGKPERTDIIEFLRNRGLTVPYRYQIKLH